ncbi:hypothetical protein APY03_7051 [Variovorax sp. WDL1]|nr:hypothetical protein APY03_7051 [Variovorax sp. WDL1]
MDFMCSAISAWRSAGVFAALIFSCISCMDFILMSICAEAAAGAEALDG